MVELQGTTIVVDQCYGRIIIRFLHDYEAPTSITKPTEAQEDRTCKGLRGMNLSVKLSRSYVRSPETRDSIRRLISPLQESTRPDQDWYNFESLLECLIPWMNLGRTSWRYLSGRLGR